MFIPCSSFWQEKTCVRENHPLFYDRKEFSFPCRIDEGQHFRVRKKQQRENLYKLERLWEKIRSSILAFLCESFVWGFFLHLTNSRGQNCLCVPKKTWNLFSILANTHFYTNNTSLLNSVSKYLLRQTVHIMNVPGFRHATWVLGLADSTCPLHL